MKQVVLIGMAIALGGVIEAPAAAQKKQTTANKKAKKKAVTKKNLKPEAVDPRHSPDTRLLNVPMRYYIWFSGDEWHLRSACSRGLGRFTGTVKLKSGKLRKCRPLGLELKPNKRDTHDWYKIEAERTRLRFRLVTGKSFDGFDFTLSEPDAELEFNLSIGKRTYAKRIFIGRQGEHPRRVPFVLQLPGSQPDAKNKAKNGNETLDSK